MMMMLCLGCFHIGWCVLARMLVDDASHRDCGECEKKLHERSKMFEKWLGNFLTRLTTIFNMFNFRSGIFLF
jgi:hypothetical protein